MALHREDINRGIDRTAAFLKQSIDRIALRTSESRAKFRVKASQAAQKAGDEMIAQGHRLKRAAGAGNGAPAERQFPC